jgi:hypothetical protein
MESDGTIQVLKGLRGVEVHGSYYTAKTFKLGRKLGNGKGRSKHGRAVRILKNLLDHIGA